MTEQKVAQYLQKIAPKVAPNTFYIIVTLLEIAEKVTKLFGPIL